MSVLIWLLLAILFGFSSISSVTESGSSEPVMTNQTCVATMDAPQRCGPEITGGLFALPSEGVVIRAVVNKGPIEPQFQAGYELQILADGAVSITEQDGETPLPVRAARVEPATLQRLLASLNNCGLFEIPQASEFSEEERPVGGAVSVIQVHLADGDWEVSGDFLSGADLAALAGCQQVLADQFELTLPE
jgi:hypothetical protein